MSNNIIISIQAQVEKALKAINGLEKEFSGLSKTVKITGAAVAGVFATSKVVDFFGDATRAAAQFENSLIGVKSVANAFGISTKDVTEAVEKLSSDGLIPVGEVAASLKNLMASGLGLDQSINLFNALKDSASFNRQGFLSLGQAVEGATQGIKNGNSTLVDNAGITKNLSVLQKEYAASIGTTVGKLTDAQKIQAAYVGILREASIFSGDAAKLSNTYSGAIARLEFSYNNLLKTVGSFITQSPEVAGIIAIIAASLNDLSKFIQDNSKEIKQFIVDILKFGADTFSFFSELTAKTIRFTNALSATVALIFNILKSKILSALSDIEKRVDKFYSLIGKAPSNLGFIDAYKKSVVEIEASKKVLDKSLGQGNFFDKLSEGAEAFSKQMGKIKSTTEEVGKVAKRANEEQKKATGETTKELTKQYDTLKSINSGYSELEKSVKKAFEGLGSDPLSFGLQLDILNEDFEKQFASISNAYEQRIITEKQFETELGKTTEAYKTAIKEFEKQRNTALTGFVLSNIAQGAKGAENLVGGLAKAGLEAVLGPAGKAFGPLVDAFVQGPDHVRKMVQEFTNSLPIVIQGFAEAGFAFIESLAENIPMLLDAFIGIIDSLVEKAPMIIESIIDKLPLLVSSIISRLPEIAIKLAIALATTVPAEIIKRIPEIVGALISGIASGLGQLFENLINQIKDFLGDPVGSVGDFFGFAQGGQAFNVTGGISGRDSVPALLTPGELVVDRSTAFALKDFLANQGTNDYDLVVASKLANIEELLKNPQIISGDVNIGYSVLSEAILKLNRSNARLA